MKKDIWVFMETGKSGRFREPSLSLLNDCRTLVNLLGGALTAVASPDDAEDEAVVAGVCGADRLLLADVVPADPAAAPAEPAEREKPWAILAASTVFAKEWLPQAAVRPNTGFASDCIGLALDVQKDCLVWTHPVLRENAPCDVVCIDRHPQIGTVRPGGGQKCRRNDTAPVQVIRFTPPAGGSARIRALELLQELSSNGIDSESAEVIVSGGGGVGGSKGFAPLHELVAAPGDAVDASRTTVDRRWIFKAYQVRQTGHTVAPRLHIACGVSGAIQHLTGMLGSGTIVTTNTDPDTWIFRYTDYRVVENPFEIVPALTREILSHRG